MARRLGFYLLLAPLDVWLGALLVIPHIDLFITSIQVKLRPRVYETGLANYAEFFTEPLYWNTFARTALMSARPATPSSCSGFSRPSTRLASVIVGCVPPRP